MDENKSILFFKTVLNFRLIISNIIIVITSGDHHISSGMNIWPEPKIICPHPRSLNCLLSVGSIL